MTSRQILVIALSFLLILVPMRPAVAQDGVVKKIETEVSKRVEAELAQMRQEMERARAEDRAAMMAVFQMAMQPKEALVAEAKEAATRLERDVTTEAGKAARALADEMPMDELRSITKDTPRHVVEDLQDRLKQKAEALHDLAEEKREDLTKALKSSCPGRNLLLEDAGIAAWDDAEVLKAYTSLAEAMDLPEGGATDEMRRLILGLSNEGKWTSHLIAWLPEDMIPQCARIGDVRLAAQESSEVDDTAKATQSVLAAALQAAISSGNPWAVAVVLILMLLAALFGVGGDGGNGESGRSDQQGDSDSPNNGQSVVNGGGEGESPAGEDVASHGGETPAPDPAVTLDRDGEWIVMLAQWPRYEFSNRNDPDLSCGIDFTKVYRADTNEAANPDPGGLKIESVRCDIDGEHEMRIRAELANDNEGNRPFVVRHLEGRWQLEPADEQP